ncbi:hypothetical protein MRX96_031865 [Rhipicephalus microplus]
MPTLQFRNTWLFTGWGRGDPHLDAVAGTATRRRSGGQRAVVAMAVRWLPRRWTCSAVRCMASGLPEGTQLGHSGAPATTGDLLLILLPRYTC